MPAAKRERIVYLIRHGQYDDPPDVFGGKLTALGRRQARRTATWLSKLPEPIAALHASDLGRAIETAELISERLDDLRVRRARVLREMAPTAVPGWVVPHEKRAKARRDLDAIQRRFLKPARGTRHEVIVCHGNLIRALVCQSLDVRLTTWLRMGTYHCGVTKVSVTPKRVALLSFNDTGHLPPEMVTVS